MNFKLTFKNEFETLNRSTFPKNKLFNRRFKIQKDYVYFLILKLSSDLLIKRILQAGLQPNPSFFTNQGKNAIHSSLEIYFFHPNAENSCLKSQN